MIKKALIISLILLAAISNTRAQSIQIYFNNGDISTYPLSEVSKISFLGSDMLLHKTDGNIVTMAIADIQKYNYDLSFSVDKVKNETEELEVLIYPNPSNGNFTIDYTLQKPGIVNISLLSIDGKLIQSILSEKKDKGINLLKWQNTELQSGTYFISIKTENQSTIKKLIIL